MMRKFFLIVFLTVIISKALYPQKYIKNTIWTVGTAYTLPKKLKHLSLFYFSQVGITNNVEIQAKPLWYWKIPNFNVKINWITKDPNLNKIIYKRLGYGLGTIHGIYYPTPLMKNNFFNINFQNVSPTLILRNEIILTINDLKHDCKKTNRFLSFKVGNLYNLSGIYYDVYAPNALLYRATRIFTQSSVWYFGVDYDDYLARGIFYSVDLDYFPIGKNYIIEHKGLIYTMWLTHLRVALGYKIALTNKRNVKPSILPLFDFTLTLGPKKQKDDFNLFKKKRNRKRNKGLKLEDFGYETKKKDKE